MKFDWRVSAVPAGAAFVLSFLVGVISGVSFGAILLRALLGALVFGAAAAGLVMLIDRFLPELRDALKSSASAAPQEGGTVDIVVDEDLLGEDGPIGVGSGPADPTAAFSAAGDEDGESVTDGEPSDLEPVEGDPTVAKADGAGGAESAGNGDASDEPVALEPVDEADDDGVEVLEEVAPEAVSAGSLPDIEGFSDSFSDAPVDVGNAEAKSEGSGEDTETMARAIRTVLKREE